MIHYPTMDPIAFHIGPLPVHWYGLMYLLAFALGWIVMLYRIRHFDYQLTKEQVGDLIFYIALGVLLGGRIGYMLFYNFPELIANPVSLFQIYDGGMSFHGGLIGVLLAVSFFVWRKSNHFLVITDLLAPVVPIGLGLGRIGNFINGELWGRVTHVPWAMVFPRAGPLPRHPSMLYECFFEGVVLFLILWLYSLKTRPRGAVTALFLLLYGVMRFALEFVRNPDSQLGFVAFGWVTRGQELCIPMVLIGIILLYYSYKQPAKIKRIKL